MKRASDRFFRKISLDHFQVLSLINVDLLAAVLSEDFKGLWQTTKEVMDNFFDSGSLH